jgi:hypothetical protein
VVAHAWKLTISVPPRHESRTSADEDWGMRYLAASIGLIGTLILIAPFH